MTEASTPPPALQLEFEHSVEVDSLQTLTPTESTLIFKAGLERFNRLKWPPLNMEEIQELVDSFKVEEDTITFTFQGQPQHLSQSLIATAFHLPVAIPTDLLPQALATFDPTSVGSPPYTNQKFKSFLNEPPVLNLSCLLWRKFVASTSKNSQLTKDMYNALIVCAQTDHKINWPALMHSKLSKALQELRPKKLPKGGKHICFFGGHFQQILHQLANRKHLLHGPLQPITQLVQEEHSQAGKAGGEAGNNEEEEVNNTEKHKEADPNKGDQQKETQGENTQKDGANIEKQDEQGEHGEPSDTGVPKDAQIGKAGAHDIQQAKKTIQRKRKRTPGKPRTPRKKLQTTPLPEDEVVTLTEDEDTESEEGNRKEHMEENQPPLPPPVQPHYVILDATVDPASTDPLPPDQLHQLFTYGEH